MLIHHVFFYMSPDATHDDLMTLHSGLESLTGIEAIKQYHIGVPAPTDRPVIERGYALSWLTVFEGAEDEEVYQNHPDHHAFVEKCKHLWTKVVVYDSIPLVTGGV
jgi:Stress responsive A/B Barrel Domain